MADKFSFKLDGVAAGRDPTILAAPLTRLEAAVLQSWCILQCPSNKLLITRKSPHRAACCERERMHT
jgi:hypothetical protein